jgi:hypothetical protein
MPVVVLLPPLCIEGSVEDRLLDALRGTFPRAMFLINAGPARLGWLPDDVTLLRPTLDLETEQAQLDRFDATRGFIEKLYGSG